jgi:hypothetical protein
MAQLLECPECKTLFPPERPSRNGGFCSRHCARIRDARKGEPSMEDKKARFIAEMMERLEQIFKV